MTCAELDVRLPLFSRDGVQCSVHSVARVYIDRQSIRATCCTAVGVTVTLPMTTPAC